MGGGGGGLEPTPLSKQGEGGHSLPTFDDPGCDTSQGHTGSPSTASVVSLDDNDPTAGCLDRAFVEAPPFIERAWEGLNLLGIYRLNF